MSDLLVVDRDRAIKQIYFIKYLKINEVFHLAMITDGTSLANAFSFLNNIWKTPSICFSSFSF